MNLHHFSSEFLAEYYESLLDTVRISTTSAGEFLDLVKVLLKTLKTHLRDTTNKESVILFWASDLSALIKLSPETGDLRTRLMSLEKLSIELKARKNNKVPILSGKEVTYVWDETED